MKSYKVKNKQTQVFALKGLNHLYKSQNSLNKYALLLSCIEILKGKRKKRTNSVICLS